MNYFPNENAKKQHREFEATYGLKATRESFATAYKNKPVPQTTLGTWQVGHRIGFVGDPDSMCALLLHRPGYL